jgi:hypothetical protein
MDELTPAFSLRVPAAGILFNLNVSLRELRLGLGRRARVKVEPPPRKPAHKPARKPITSRAQTRAQADHKPRANREASFVLLRFSPRHEFFQGNEERKTKTCIYVFVSSKLAM